MRNNKRKNGSSLKVGGKYIDETPIRLTEIRLHSLMERTYERAVKDNEKKTMVIKHCGLLLLLCYYLGFQCFLIQIKRCIK